MQGRSLKVRGRKGCCQTPRGRVERRKYLYLALNVLPGTMANEIATLVWLANLAALELHPSLALAQDVTCPTMMVFDLDPGPPANIVQCCQVAFWLREIFEHFSLQSFPKTSGSKGLQIYVPLNTPTTYDGTKPFARALAQLLEHDHPNQSSSQLKNRI